jgi:hypothetical protein
MSWQDFHGASLAALLIAVSFAAGLNVYATLATLGLLARASVLDLPSQLSLVANWWVIAGALFLFAIEFFGDKIPAFDLVWNALQTFVRVPLAALFAFRATSQISPQIQLLAALAGGAIALASHSGKIAVRATVTPSPEPVSNMALSFGEDAIVVFLTWLATRHPYTAAAFALVGLLLIFLAIRFVIRSLRKLFRNAIAEL